MPLFYYQIRYHDRKASTGSKDEPSMSYALSWVNKVITMDTLGTPGIDPYTLEPIPIDMGTIIEIRIGLNPDIVKPNQKPGALR